MHYSSLIFSLVFGIALSSSSPAHASEFTLIPYTLADKPRFDSILNKTRARFAACVAGAEALGDGSLPPLGQVQLDNQHPSRRFIYAIRADGVGVGELQISARKSLVMKALTITGCEIKAD